MDVGVTAGDAKVMLRSVAVDDGRWRTAGDAKVMLRSVALERWTAAITN
jgi:hypothetical protein